MTTQEVVKALRCCADGSYGCLRCPVYHEPYACREVPKKAAEMIEYMARMSMELNLLGQERDTWKRRADAAEKDINNISSLSLCVVCKHWDFGKCALAAEYDDPSWECDRDDNHFEWRGPCAENGGADNE